MVELRARVGMVFQKPNPFPKSIYENIAYGPRIHGLTKAKGELDELVESSLKRAGLWNEVKDRLDEPGTGLSGGQQQRLCIARAVATKPDVILMDEPCSALDPIATAVVEELIEELRENYTIIIVTHSMQQARRVSQKVAFFHLGNLVEYDETETMFTNPKDERNRELHLRPHRLRRKQSSRMSGLTSIPHTIDEDLEHIESLVTQMGGLVETQITDAVTALVTRDEDLGERVRDDDKRVDALEAEVDAAVVRILASRQPMAQDLRAVVGVMKIASNLERIGDYAKNIAKRASVLGEFRHIGASADILKRMSRMVQVMLKDALDAHITRDAELADDVRSRDEEVDQMHNTLFRELLTYMMEDPRNITPCMHLLFIAKNLERMGDHVTGVSEQIHYVVAGAMPDEERPKGDLTSLTTLDADDIEGRSGT